jgi:hypothetical protein
MKRFLILLALLAVPACSKTQPVETVAPVAVAAAPVEAVQPAKKADKAAPNTAPAPVAKKVARKAAKKAAKKLDIEALAVEYAGFRAARANCLRLAVAEKIAGDIRLGQIRDFGNVLAVEGLCYNGQFRSFDEAVKLLKAKAKTKARR